MTDTPVIVGTIRRHKRHPERLAFVNPDGTPGGYYGREDTLDAVRAQLAKKGYTVSEDGSVTRPS